MTSVRYKRILKRIIWIFVIGFILLNMVAYLHAYKFTHFSENDITKTKTASKLTVGEKMKTIFFGINNPRPVNNKTPAQQFETITLQSHKKIQCWSIKADSAKGTVILFHGYGGQKASLLDKANEFLKLGYSILLVDFMGSGGSEGNQTTIGYREAQDVKACYDYVARKSEKSIYLFGTSLGAVAILKCLKDHNLSPKGIILESPFGSMYQTVCARFKAMKVPTFPMAGLLVFWGGVQNGFWAFGHNPSEYAKSIKCPTLLLYGEKDEKVSLQEINDIYANLNGKKTLSTYPLAGHENYLKKYKKEWVSDVQTFLISTR